MSEKSEKPFSFELVTDVHIAAQGVHEYLALSSELEVTLQRREEELQKHIEEQLKDVPKEEHDEVIDSYGWNLHQFQSLFPSMHREAMFLSLYNYVEYSLNVVCEGIGEEIDSRVRLKDIKGNGVERAILFLKLVPGFDLPGAREERAFIKNANRLRNFIVHNGAILPGEENHPVNSFVRSQPALSGEPERPVRFASEFLSIFGSKIQSLFEEIGNDMQRFMGNRV